MKLFVNMCIQNFTLENMVIVLVASGSIPYALNKFLLNVLAISKFPLAF